MDILKTVVTHWGVGLIGFRFGVWLMSIMRNKLSRGKFSAAFLFQCLDAIGTEEVRLR